MGASIENQHLLAGMLSQLSKSEKCEIIQKNRKVSCEKKSQRKFQKKFSNFVNFLAIIVIFHNFPFVFNKNKVMIIVHLGSIKTKAYNFKQVRYCYQFASVHP